MTTKLSPIRPGEVLMEEFLIKIWMQPSTILAVGWNAK